MTSRERWTVYPLLFLALGLAVRSIVVPSGEFLAARVDDLECLRLSCQGIVIVGEDGTTLMRIGREAAGDSPGAGGGRIELHDAAGNLRRAISSVGPAAR
jgi:hypothetical protein